MGFENILMKQLFGIVFEFNEITSSWVYFNNLQNIIIYKSIF